MGRTIRIIASGGIPSALVAALLVASPAAAHPEIEAQISDVTEHIAVRTDDASLYLRRGELHRVHRDWEAALADFERARGLGSGPIVDFHVGRMQLEAGRYAAAAETLDRFLAVEPEHEAGLVARARARVALGRPLEAAADLSRALAVTSRPQPTFYLERARALMAAGDRHLDEAIRGLDEGLERLGRPVTLELEAIDLEVRAGRYDAALARIDRIAAASVRREAWLIRRGELLEQAGRPAQAREAYTLALAAIDALPPSRRGNRAVQRLQAQARSALARLGEGS